MKLPPTPSDDLSGVEDAPALVRWEYSLTDSGSAEYFAKTFQDMFRYVPDFKKWIVFNPTTGSVWNADATGYVYLAAKAIPDLIEQFARSLDDEKRAAPYFAHAKYLRSERGRRAIVKLAQYEEGVTIPATALDANPDLLNVKNGTIDLRSGNFREAVAADFITKQAGVFYEPAAKAPTFERFIREVLPNDAVREFVQRLFGYYLTAHVSEQVVVNFVGGGSNGKSTLVKTIEGIMADYAIAAAPGLLLVSRGGERHPAELAHLRGARLATVSEIGAGKMFDEEKLKRLSGGDAITARGMGENFYTFQPSHKFVICTNALARVRNSDYALWRRMRVVRFERTFRDGEKDTSLPEKLASERSGILNWLIEGAVEWYRRGLDAPKEVLDATAEYQEREDVLGQFLGDRTTPDPEGFVTRKKLYAAYSSWCFEAEEKAIDKDDFRRAMAERLRELKRNGDRGFAGIRINTPSARAAEGKSPAEAFRDATAVPSTRPGGAPAGHTGTAAPASAPPAGTGGAAGPGHAGQGQGAGRAKSNAQDPS